MAIGNFNYGDTMRQARNIRDRAQDMLSLKNNKLSNAAQSIDVVWKGDAARKFLDHCGNTRDDIDKTANELINIAGRIEQAAEILRKADEDAKAKMGR